MSYETRSLWISLSKGLCSAWVNTRSARASQGSVCCLVLVMILLRTTVASERPYARDPPQ